MIRKCINMLFGFVILAGLVLMMGTAGASDLDAITFWELITQGGYAVALIGAGFIGFKITEVDE